MRRLNASQLISFQSKPIQLPTDKDLLQTLSVREPTPFCAKLYQLQPYLDEALPLRGTTLFVAFTTFRPRDLLACLQRNTGRVGMGPNSLMVSGAAIFGVSAPPAIWSCPILHRFLRDGGRICRPFHSECLLSLCGPERSRVFALIALQLVGHPE